jgi:lipoprotein-anchoring transpeptidase ErfK/SrfK
VVVSIAKQQLWAYQDGKLVMTSLVTTGMPQLPTPRGTFHIFLKETNVMFYSPWPPGSPYYYTPEHINYAMEFLGGGFYIHDAPWRHEFGPGTNVPHTDPDGTHETGSHGCVNMPTSTAAQLYHWIMLGATVVIQ